MYTYYSNRAKEYETVYDRDDAVRQAEQFILQQKLKELFREKEILEVACGTGYWTQYVVEVAAYITAIDYSEEVLDVEKAKELPKERVSFHKGDAFELGRFQKTFQGAYANFWFSHIAKEEVTNFLEQFHKVLEKGAMICFADNMYNEGIGGQLLYKDGDENTYKVRSLASGEHYEIIKNYYTKEELIATFELFAIDLEVHMGECFWWITYTVK
ncbi:MULTISPECIES: class I SAM-dependent methyltransferase [Bacillus]|uniref:SAM-dependent methyltransferase n=2 Tax=Bacillus pseudomycoides TaxID=64104 RepID=A0A1Y3MG29_9BACI|nr:MULTISPECIES: class I SAM-dependent methyltransferase [Bacillus cereus group]EOP73176.1 hypothetical protein KOW_00586 [Bacillus cereus VDM006]EOQ09289.1 hypothetical protein KOY_03258 [Bacillus cereus VDM021]MDF2084362.1 class I SAM-dependent methyltransferase [Bacillus pseudomycoides]OUM49407.1 SAM-dependent methyltransferase [Bacillus pseudomycoides]